MHLALYQDEPPSQAAFDRIAGYSLLDRLKALDYKVCRKGLAVLDPSRNPLIPLGMEIAGARVVKNGYGVFSLAWRAAQQPDWAESIAGEVARIRAAFKQAHGSYPRFLICYGPGGWVDDKPALKSAGLLKRGPRCYVLPSGSPGCLKEILEDIARRSHAPLARALKSTLLMGPATEDLERLAALYRDLRIDSGANLIPLELPPDVMVPRHAAPLTRSCLYPLALSKANLRSWIEGASLTVEEIRTVWRLAAFVHAQVQAGRDKLTLLLPKVWSGASRWTRRVLEESLPPADGPGLSVYTDEAVRLVNYQRPKAASQDRLFLAVQLKGEAGPAAAKAALLRRSGYPVAVWTLERATPLSKFMQSIHYLAFGAAWLRGASFVAQAAAGRAPALPDPSPHQVDWRGGLNLRFSHLPKEIRQEFAGLDAPSCCAAALSKLAGQRRIDSGEFAVTAEIRYSKAWRAVERCLERAAERIFRARLKMPARVTGEIESAASGRYLTLIAGSQPLPAAHAVANLVITMREAGERTVPALDALFARTAAALKKS